MTQQGNEARPGAAHRERHARGERRGGGPGLRDLFDPRRIRRAMWRKGVRPAVLAVLLDRPMHGYQVIQELETRTGGRWRPSAGSIYPTLQQLEDEGLVRGEEQDGRKVYTLTDAGRTEAEESPLLRHPWFDKSAQGPTDLRKLALQLAGASMQVGRVGSSQAQRRAAEILVDARKKLYGLLAEDDADIGADPDPGDGETATSEEETSA
jgi:DNA-binding PadR family transcriptional regulator